MTEYDEDYIIKKNTLANVDPHLAEEFERLYRISAYHYEPLYQVFMAHGEGAIKIIQYAIGRDLPTWALLLTSDQTMVITKDLSRLSGRVGNKEEKLPKKLRNGWK